MRPMRLWVVALVMISARAGATVPMCLEVHADNADEVGLRKLVLEQLAHHPTHQVVEEGCASRLSVELFAVAGARYLTVRANREVPIRFGVKTARDIDEKIGEALRQVLQHDPVYLSEDLSRLNASLRAGANLVKNGRNRYRLEMFELIGAGGRNAIFASGASLAFNRGIDHLQVFARLSAAGSPKSLADNTLVLRALVGADAGVLYETSARANTTFYIGGGVGLHYLRFEGKLGTVDATPANTLLFSAVVRTGVRFLRFYNFEMDLFAQMHLPFYRSNDPDTTLVDTYTPYCLAGLGIGF